MAGGPRFSCCPQPVSLSLCSVCFPRGLLIGHLLPALCGPDTWYMHMSRHGRSLALGLREPPLSLKAEKEADEAEKALGGVNQGFRETRLMTAV